MNTIAIIVAYLLGSISTAIIVCRFAGLHDPREEGSGNPGASNVLRIAGKTYAAITLLGDGLKGFVAVFIAFVLGVHGWMLGIVAVAAVLGHMFPAFFKFQGGKGVATAIGCFFALSLPLGVTTLVIWLVLAFVFRYASLASLAATIAAPFIILLFQPAYFLGLAIVAALIAWRHLENINRLKTGSEVKIDLTSETKSENS